MSITTKSLNGDTSFLLTFSPAIAPPSSPGLFPGSLTVVVDPWLGGDSKILSSAFSLVRHRTPPCLSSLDDLPLEPDIVLVSQDKPDHCHEATLRTLSPSSRTLILAHPGAARRIRSWNHFHPSQVVALPKYDPNSPVDSFFRLALPSFSPSGCPGELTVSLILPAKRDMTGLHTALGITYRSPSSVLSVSSPFSANFPPTPPDSPFSSEFSPASSTSSSFSSSRPVEPTLSVFYSPHGVPCDSTLNSYVARHLAPRPGAFPVSALIHSLHHVRNPWYLGGTIASGAPGGLLLANALKARSWIAAHDADKHSQGFSVSLIRTRCFSPDEVHAALMLLSSKETTYLTSPRQKYSPLGHIGRKQQLFDSPMSPRSEVSGYSDEDQSTEDDDSLPRKWTDVAHHRNSSPSCDVVNLQVGDEYRIDCVPASFLATGNADAPKYGESGARARRLRKMISSVF